MNKYMGDKQFLKFFQNNLNSKKTTNRSMNPVGTDYNRAQQAVNAVLGRNNQGQQGYAAHNGVGGQAAAAGRAMESAVRNRSVEQTHRKGTKAAENNMAKTNSIGARLFGNG